jgi:hypothetical protein
MLILLHLSMPTFRMSDFLAQTEGMLVRDFIGTGVCGSAATIEEDEAFSTLSKSVNYCNLYLAKELTHI